MTISKITGRTFALGIPPHAFGATERLDLEIDSPEQIQEAAYGSIALKAIDKDDKTNIETPCDIYVCPVLIEELYSSIDIKDLFLHVVKEMSASGYAEFDFSVVPLDQAVADFSEQIEEAYAQKKEDEYMLFSSNGTFVCAQKKDKILTKEGEIIPIEKLSL